MDDKLRKALTRTVGLSILAVVLGLMGWLSTAQPERQDAGQKGAVPQVGSPLHISGLSFSNYHGGFLSSSIRVDRMFVQPRKLGFFRVKSVNELVLDNARFEFHQRCGENENERQESLGHEMAASLNGLAQLRGVGRVTQGNVRGMTLRILREGKIHAVARSEQALMDFQKGQTRMGNATIIMPKSGRRLKSDLIIWDDRREMFLVPGEYSLYAHGDRRKGKGLAVDLDLVFHGLTSR